MEREHIKIPQPSGPSAVPLAECALARAIRTIGDGWTLLILREVVCGVERFDAMCEDLAIPRSVLSNRLSRLLEAGIIQRMAYREPGQRTRSRYVLSERGRALVPALVALRGWAEEHLPGGRSRLRFRDSDGQEVSARLIREDGNPVDDVSRVSASAALSGRP